MNKNLISFCIFIDLMNKGLESIILRIKVSIRFFSYHDINNDIINWNI